MLLRNIASEKADCSHYPYPALHSFPAADCVAWSVFVWYREPKRLYVYLHPVSTVAVGGKVLPAPLALLYSLLSTPLIASAAALSKCL